MKREKNVKILIPLQLVMLLAYAAATKFLLVGESFTVLGYIVSTLILAEAIFVMFYYRLWSYSRKDTGDRYLFMLVILQMIGPVYGFLSSFGMV